MDRKVEWALALLDEITDWAIGMDTVNYIGEIETEFEMTLDEAFQIIGDSLRKRGN